MQPIAGQVFIKLMGMPWQDAFPFVQIFADMCFEGQATPFIAKLEALGISGVSLANQNAQQPFGLMTVQPAIGFWVLSGTTASGLPIQEYAGSLIDRMTKPNPFVDGAGGSNLKVREYPAEGYAQLYWSA